MQQFMLINKDDQQVGMAFLSVAEKQCWYQIQIWNALSQRGPGKKVYWAWLIAEDGREIALEALQEWGWGGAFLIGSINTDTTLRVKELLITEEDRERKPRHPGKSVAGSKKLPAPPVWLPLPDPTAHPRQVIGVIWDERGEVKYLAHGIWGHKNKPPVSQPWGWSAYRRFEAAAGDAGQQGWGYWLMYWNPKTNQIVYLNY